jgi:hypothetical protein
MCAEALTLHNLRILIVGVRHAKSEENMGRKDEGKTASSRHPREEFCGNPKRLEVTHFKPGRDSG